MPSEHPVLPSPAYQAQTPQLPLGHGWEAPPREALGRQQCAGSSALPTPHHWGICVLAALGATSSHKHGVVATNCKGPQRAKQSYPALGSSKASLTTGAVPKPLLFKPNRSRSQEPLKPSENRAPSPAWLPGTDSSHHPRRRGPKQPGDGDAEQGPASALESLKERRRTAVPPPSCYTHWVSPGRSSAAGCRGHRKGLGSGERGCGSQGWTSDTSRPLLPAARCY